MTGSESELSVVFKSGERRGSETCADAGGLPEYTSRRGGSPRLSDAVFVLPGYGVVLLALSHVFLGRWSVAVLRIYIQ